MKSKSILITGATGSLGNALVKSLLDNTNIERIVIYTRDELKQHQLRQEIGNSARLRWFIGDVRDLDRLKRAMNGIELVVHAAALKQVDTGEYNPMEFIKTNVIGSQNVIEAAIDSGVEKVVALSTDKASSPINLYGATKLTADKLFVAANNYGSKYGTKFSVVRYGNVMGSRGSVIPYWLNLAKKGLDIPVTDLRMTRFWISITQAVEFVIDSFDLMNGGELYVPRIPSMRIAELAQVVAPNSKLVEIGMRPGEKLHEEMISAEDMLRTVLFKDRFIVNPVIADWGYKVPEESIKVPYDNAYRSDNNERWLNQSEMKSMLQKYFEL